MIFKNFDERFKYQEQFIEQQIQIIKNELNVKNVRVGSFQEDCKICADLVIEDFDRLLTVGLRVRQEKYLRYANEFTVRSYCPHGKTEFEKIFKDGHGDFILYGFDVNGVFSHWSLIFVDKLRHLVNTKSPKLRYEVKRNPGDGNSFIAFDIHAMPEIIIASSHK